MDIDAALKEVGSWGRYQIMLYILIVVSSIPNAFITIQFVFTQYEPNYHCKLPDEFSNTTVKVSNESRTFLDFALPNEEDAFGQIRKSRCRMFDRNYSAYETQDWSKYFNDSDETIKCTDGWAYQMEPYQSSAITDFSMVCDEDWKPPLVISIYMTGMLFGSMGGSLADRVGRKPIFLGSCLLQVLCMILASFSWDFTSYVVNVFLCGCTSLVNYMAAFVLATEMCGVQWRNFFALGTMYSYSIGYCLLSFFGFLVQNWRRLFQLTAALSAVMYIPNIWLFPESARWLIQKGRTEEGFQVLKKISRANGTERSFNEALEVKGKAIVSEKVPQVGVKEVLRVLFQSGLSARFMACTACWCATAMVYYGISYYSTSFSDDRFLNVLFSGLAEIPSLMASYYLVKIIGRPRTLSLLMMICALSNISLPFVPEDASITKTVLSMLGKGACSATFFLVFLIGSEISPTLQRSACMAVFSMCSRIASFIAPFVLYARKIHPFIPNGIMGAIGIACAGLSLFCIPETKGVPMPDSVEEAKNNQRIYGLNILRNLAYKIEKDQNISDDKYQQENLL